MRDCPVLAGWPADVDNNRHANVHVKTPDGGHTVTVRQQCVKVTKGSEERKTEKKNGEKKDREGELMAT